MMKSTHSARLARWLGEEKVASVSDAMRGWYGPPIALAGVPGAVYATGDGDFVGECRAGWEATTGDRLFDILKRVKRGFRAATSPARRMSTLGTGFSSLSDLISEATAGGKRQELLFYKNGEGGDFVGCSLSLWQMDGQPYPGSSASAAPGGDAPTSATTGALGFVNASGTDTLHFVAANVLSRLENHTLLLYDRIFQVAKTMSSTATEAVTGVPTRYQSTTPGDDDYAGGNFMFPECTSDLGAGAYNWDTCLYTDQDGNTGVTLPSCGGYAVDFTNLCYINNSRWFFPLAAGDTGVKALTQMQCDASVSGGVDFVIGHPIAFMPCPIASQISITDGINTAFNLTRIFDDACLAFLDICKPITSYTRYTGSITLVSG